MSGWRLNGIAAVAMRGLVALALVTARADAANPANAAAPLRIWYRSSEGCPEGAAFVARLAELGRQATLARVGDRVDFVVTIARGSTSSSGRLERQTARGTVAIRELDAPSCDEVTEALALSLEIALDPANEALAASASSSAAPASNGEVADGGDAARAAGSAPSQPPDRRVAAPAREDTRRGAVAVGAQGSLAKGLARSWAPGGAVFAELRARDATALAGRLSLGAALARDSLATIDVDVFWLAGRVEACAFELRSGPLSLQPCAGAELGLLRAGGSGRAARHDSGIWAAAAGLLRAGVELDARFALEAQVGAALPFVRYAVGSSLGGDLFRTEAVVPTLAVGGRWAP